MYNHMEIHYGCLQKSSKTAFQIPHVNAAIKQNSALKVLTHTKTYPK